MNLTLKWLEERDACKEGIDFVVRNKLIGFPLDKLVEIDGDCDGFVEWIMSVIEVIYEYDSNRNVIHFKDSHGFEKWYEYDSNGNETHSKSSGGYETWHEYDSNGNETLYRNSMGFVNRMDYDEANNKVHSKNSDDYEKWYEYDSGGNLIHFNDSDGVENSTPTTFYSNGQLKSIGDCKFPKF